MESGDTWSLLRVLDAEKFNKNNRAMVWMWDSKRKRKVKILIEPIWSPSAIEQVYTGHPSRPPFRLLVPGTRWIAEWASDEHNILAVFDTWKKND